ncbi:hypothetical protein PHLCEN_2v9868 [Hermanssonia centrifuga]|uniref:Uncharacterized protein n=1 Tax=Hermanssonia centrifuga TaxID=98765 RepID=A0A2R6NPK0_9APHY|nr:hypothetical protein PHLCEN_2v9868 [Hermanssonia centrifuga]
MISFANPDEDDVIRAISQAVRTVQAGKHDPQKAHDLIRGFYDWNQISERVERVYDAVFETKPYDFWTRMRSESLIYAASDRTTPYRKEMEDEKLSVKTSDISEEDVDGSRLQKGFAKITFFLTRWGVETNGIQPIPPEARTDTKMFQMFFIWFSANMNVLGLGVGTSGPAFFGLGVKQSLITLLIVDLICCAIPSYL